MCGADDLAHGGDAFLLEQTHRPNKDVNSFVGHEPTNVEDHRECGAAWEYAFGGEESRFVCAVVNGACVGKGRYDIDDLLPHCIADEDEGIWSERAKATLQGVMLVRVVDVVDEFGSFGADERLQRRGDLIPVVEPDDISSLQSRKQRTKHGTHDEAAYRLWDKTPAADPGDGFDCRDDEHARRRESPRVVTVRTDGDTVVDEAHGVGGDAGKSETVGRREGLAKHVVDHANPPTMRRYCSAVEAQENLRRAAERACAPIFSRRVVSVMSCCRTSANSSADPGSTSATPPSAPISGRPPTREATTGRPQAIASVLTMPKASNQMEGQQKTSASRYSAANSEGERYPRNSTLEGLERCSDVM